MTSSFVRLSADRQRLRQRRTCHAGRDPFLSVCQQENDRLTDYAGTFDRYPSDSEPTTQDKEFQP